MTLPAPLITELEDQARVALGHAFRIEHVEPCAGGSINTALRLRGAQASVFAKLRPAADVAMFQAEAADLNALRTCYALRTPQVLGHGTQGDHAYLLLEWLDIQPLREDAEARRAAEALAALHHCTGAAFGWPYDNFIGPTPQQNTESDNWSRFYVQQRLRPLLDKVAARGLSGDLLRQGTLICDKVPALFLDYRPQASLLHGDLWSGNLGCLPDGRPVLFDPASYYGDREADVAMTELFGGLPLSFYATYRAAWPLNEGYEARKPLYNLYHLLNHLLLFGRSYLGATERLAGTLARALTR